MKLKTTIYGKSSTLIGTPDEIYALLDAVRRTAKQRAIDSLPRIVAAGERINPKPTSITIHHTGDDRKATPEKTVHVKNVFKPTFEPIAQTREEIVNEAIADVAELLRTKYIKTSAGVGSHVGKHVGSTVIFAVDNQMGDRVDFFVNKKKRVVVAKLFIECSTGDAVAGDYATTGIARCAPSDVFNEHVGKAIALRRALGLEVPAKYYEVGGIAPEGKQVGDVVKFNGVGKNVYQTVLTDDFTSVGGPWSGKTMIGSVYGDKSKVIDDSARYVAPSTPAAKVVYVD